MNTYALEKMEEAARLERQSKTEQCSYERELRGIHLFPNTRILDAGCGSGVVSRYLAQSQSGLEVVGCDFSEIRVQQAKKLAQGISNLRFQVEDISKLSFESGSFDTIICRYVLEHLEAVTIQAVMAEFFRVLKPGGMLWVIDIDGVLGNLYPVSNLLTEMNQKLEATAPMDFRIGRKLPHLFCLSGFKEVEWELDTILCQGEVMQTELQLMRDRLNNFMPFLEKFSGSKKIAQSYVADYLLCMQEPGAVLFYNKFIVHGKK